MKKFSKNTRMGTYAFGLSAVAVVIVIVLNLILHQLPTSIARPDISGSGLYNISDTTTQVLSDLDTDVEIILIGETDRVDQRVRTFLDKYTSLSPHLIYSQVDPVAHPSILETYDTTSNTVVVRCEETGKQTIVYGSGFQGYTDAIITYDPDAYMYSQVLQEVAFDGDGQLTAAVNFVTSEVNETVYTLTGHNEVDLSASLTSMIEKASLTMAAEPLNLLMDGGIPDDCSLLIVNAPGSDLSADELDMLLAYLEDGGQLILVMETSDLPNFNTLTQTYGLAIQEGVLGDRERFFSAYASTLGYFCFAPVLSTTSDITADITTDAMLLSAHGMLQVDPARDTISVESFLTTSEQGYLFIDAETSSDPQLDTYIIGATASEETANGTARLTVISSASLISETITTAYPSMSNLDIFMNAVVSHFDGEVTNTSIPSVSLSVEYVYVSNPTVWGAVFIFVLPLVVLIGGLIYWLNRRKR